MSTTGLACDRQQTLLEMCEEKIINGLKGNKVCVLLRKEWTDTWYRRGVGVDETKALPRVQQDTARPAGHR